MAARYCEVIPWLPDGDGGGPEGDGGGADAELALETGGALLAVPTGAAKLRVPCAELPEPPPPQAERMSAAATAATAVRVRIIAGLQELMPVLVANRYALRWVRIFYAKLGHGLPMRFGDTAA